MEAPLEAAEDSPSRYVPLHEVQQRYSRLGGPPGPKAKARRPQLKAALTGIEDLRGACPPSPPETERESQRRRRTEATGRVRLSAADLIRGFRTFAEGSGEEAVASRDRVQREQEALLHNRCLASIAAMPRLGTEMDLTFRALGGLADIPFGGASADGKGKRGGADEEEEVVLQLELQPNPRKSGGAQNLLFRCHVSWDLQVLSSPSRTVVTSAWPSFVTSSRPSTPVDAGQLPPVHGHQEAGVRFLGDGAHALTLDVRERVPETLVIRRLKTGAGPEGGGQGAAGVPAAGGVAVGAAGAWLVRLDAESDRLGGATRERLALQLGAPSNVRSAPSGNPWSNTGLQAAGTGGLSPAAAATAAAAASASDADFAQGYLRELRGLLKTIGEGAPKAARSVEAAVKGLVLSLDLMLLKERRRAEALERQLARMEGVGAETEALRRQLSEARQDLRKLQDHATMQEQRLHEEVRLLQDKVRELKEEIHRLTPDTGVMEGVAGLLGECGDLMNEMEDECAKQGKILEDLASHAKSIVSGATEDDPQKLRRREGGRVVELANGDILLRPYGVVDQATQLNDTDLFVGDDRGPIRLRMPKVRMLLTANEGQDVPGITSEELHGEIDKIYVAKMSADAETDAMGFARRELVDFIVDYYLEQLGTVRQAQQRLCGILECIRRTDGSQSPKVALFARFLEFCEYDKALPLPMLNVVLQAKRYAQGALLKQKPEPAAKGDAMGRTNTMRSEREGRSKRVDSIVNGSSAYVESSLPVAAAFDAGVRALPPGSIGLRELFACLAKSAEVEGTRATDGKGVRDFTVLMMIVHDRLQHDQAAQVRELIHRAEKREAVTADEFREALRASQVGEVDESVWKGKLCSVGQPGLISSDALLEHLGGGSVSRMPKATVLESAFLTAVTEAVIVDYADRADRLRRLWDRRVQEKILQEEFGASDGAGALPYSDFRSVLLSADPEIPAPTLRSLYTLSVEASRSCFQSDEDHVPVVGSLKPAICGMYGGEVVTYKMLSYAAMAHRLFMPDRMPKSWGLANTSTTLPRGPPSPPPVRGGAARSKAAAASRKPARG